MNRQDTLPSGTRGGRDRPASAPRRKVNLGGQAAVLRSPPAMRDRELTEAVIASSIARYHLSEAQTRVVWLLLSGLTNEEIATALGLAEQTVKNHLVAMYDKVGARHRTEFALRLLGVC
jgi:DNA-binding NarL/FixJ family response regulator